MFGSIPPFFTSFPYGAVPSSGVASTKFVDLFNAQTVAGAKTFTGPMIINLVDVASTAETPLTLGVTGATGQVIFESTSSTDATFLPRMRGVGTTTSIPLTIMGQIATDSGVSPAVRIAGRVSTSSSVATRNLLDVTNNSTQVLTVSPAGAVTIDGGSAPALTMGGRVNLKSYTVATLPSAATAGGIVYVSDAAVAPCLAFTNGTNWKRCDNAATTVV